MKTKTAIPGDLVRIALIRRDRHGKPLGRHRLSEREFEGAVAALRSAPEHQSGDVFAGVFCLVAVDILLRSDAGGAWTWERIRHHLGPRFDDERMRGLTGQGLRYWGRQLRVQAGGRRRFLRSLVLEGGLPANLLAREELGRFLRCVQSEIDAIANIDLTAIEHFAARHEHLLPPAWREPLSCSLAAELLLSLRPWRSRLPDTVDGSRAVAHLNASHPGWRDELPINLDDAGAARLIGSLLAAPRQRQDQLPTLRALVGRRLAPAAEGPGWRCVLAPEREGLLPPSIAELHPFSAADPPLRVRIALTAGQGREIAIAEREGAGRWRVAPLGRRTVPFPADEGVVGRLLVNGQEIGHLLLPGGEPMPDLPWVFAESAEADGSLCLLGFGSRTVQAATLYLVAEPGTGRFDTGEGGVEELGPVLGTERVVFRVTGTVVWRPFEGGAGIRLRTGSAAAAPPQEMALTPRRPPWQVLAPEASLGPPLIGLPSGQGGRPHLRANRRGARWEALPASSWPLGEVDIALIENGLILDCRRLLILPADASVTVSNTERELEVTLRGFAPSTARIEQFAPVERTERPGVTTLRVALPDSPPPAITLRAGLAGEAGETRHRLPLRLRHGGFRVGDGGMLPAHAARTLGGLAEVTACSGDADGRPAVLSARLTGTSASAFPGLRIELAASFVGEMPMAGVRGLLRRMWTTLGDQDAELTVDVLRDGMSGRLMRLSAFTHDLKLDGPAGRVALTDKAGAVVWPPDGGGLAVLDLTEPEAGVVPLERGGKGWWLLPASAEADGPRLVVGSGSLERIVRPRVWSAVGEPRPGLAGLREAVALREHGVRTAALAQRLMALAADPHAQEHRSDWALLDATLAAAHTYAPAVSFDLLCAVAREPSVLAHWALRADDRTLGWLAALEDDLPMAWCLVPLAAWQDAAVRFRTFYAALLGDRALVDDTLGQRLNAFSLPCPSAAGPAWILRERLALPRKQGEPAMEQFGHPALRAVAEQAAGPRDDPAAWVAALGANLDWRNLSDDLRRAAAGVAAQVSIGAAGASELLVAGIRTIRHLEPDVFDEAFRFALMREVLLLGH
ncbi:MAG: STY4851/ECs_5259 family protein [Acetobacteraceae bacterium]|nr:STY4851/ECs_5259 family protein [Acetobacteraceae bacterium]